MIWVETYEVKKSDGTTKELERIYTYRGDKGTLEYSIKQDDESLYEFQQGDKIEFTVFENKGYSKTPVLNKEITPTPGETSVNIELTATDTTLGEAENKAITYWYEIALNGDETVNGYDSDDGPLEFILLPAKAGE